MHTLLMPSDLLQLVFRQVFNTDPSLLQEALDGRRCSMQFSALSTSALPHLLTAIFFQGHVLDRATCIWPTAGYTGYLHLFQNFVSQAVYICVLVDFFFSIKSTYFSFSLQFLMPNKCFFFSPEHSWLIWPKCHTWILSVIYNNNKNRHAL